MTASWASSPAVRNVMRANRSRDTGPELALRRELRRLGQTGYRVHWRLPVARRRTADVAWPGLRLAVFLDGAWWHACQVHSRPPRTNVAYWTAKFARNRERDAETDRLLEEAGWLAVRLCDAVPAAALAEAVAWVVELARIRRGYNRPMAGKAHGRP